MIQTKDLRLNNIVTDKNGFVLEVVSIFKNEVYLDFKDNEGDFFEEDFKSIYPYPITEELLIKIGAVKRVHKDFLSYEIEGMQINLINNQWVEYVHRVNIIGLHKLQNLFYHTRGKELEFVFSEL